MSTALVPTGNIFTPDGFATTQKIAETLVKSGILPRGIDTPAKAFAVIVKGWEIGVGPMRALTGIHLIEGKPSVSPELKLERFRERGGRVQWLRTDNTVAECTFTAPNGDTHTETVTIAEMQSAGVAGKDNWRKWPKSMLRARCVAFGLRALGEGDGSHTPDELGAVTSEEGSPEEVSYTPPTAKEAPQDAGKSSPGVARASTVAAIVSPDATAPTTSHGPTTATVKPPRADTVKHNNVFASDVKVAKLTALASAAGTLCDGGCAVTTERWSKKAGASVPKTTRCVFHTQLAAFKDPKGEPCKAPNELSEEQIDNLLSRYEAKLARQEQRAADEPHLDIAPRPTLADLMAQHMDGDESADWIHATFGRYHVQELDADQCATAFALLAAFGTDGYDDLEAKARAMGKIR